MSDEYHALKHRRLPNWGRWAWHNPDAPDASCANPLYAMMVRSDGDDYGYGNITEATIRRLQLVPMPAQDELDEADAEVVEAIVLQTPRSHRAVLVSRYVLRRTIDHMTLNAAIRAAADVIYADLEARIKTATQLGCGANWRCKVRSKVG